jgi:hypothetical protein
MKAFCAEQNAFSFLEEGTVRCDYDLEAERIGNIQEFRKVGVKKRLTEQVKIQIFRHLAKLGCRMGEFLHRHKFCGAGRAVAKRA